MRPGPSSRRSARSWSVRLPVMIQSRAGFLSSLVLTGSLLVTEMILVTGAGSTRSATEAVMVTLTILSLGGQSVAGLAVRLLITGGVVSRTVKVNEPVDLLPAASLAVTVTVVTPSGKVEPGAVL